MSPFSPLLLTTFLLLSGEVVFRLLGRAGSAARWFRLLTRTTGQSRGFQNVGHFALRLPLVLAVALSDIPWDIEVFIIGLLLLARLFLGEGNDGTSLSDLHWKRECGLPARTPWPQALRAALRISLVRANVVPGVWCPWAVVSLVFILNDSLPPRFLALVVPVALWSLASALVETRRRPHSWLPLLAFIGVIALGALIISTLSEPAVLKSVALPAAAAALLLRVRTDARGRGGSGLALGRVFDPARISYGQFVQQMGFLGVEEARPWVRPLIRLRTLSMLLTPARAHLLVWRADLLAALVVAWVRAVI